jgi:S-layer protein
MALKDDLLSYYKNANLGVSASGDDLLKIDSFTGGSYTPDQAKAATLGLLSDTTAVAIATYQAFTGHAPSYDGLTFLLNSATNTADLNDAYYAKFNQENRFINFSINLATGSGEGATAFASLYGTATYKDVVASAYDKYIGVAAATAAGKDPVASINYLSSDAVVTYLTNYVKQTTPYKTDAEIQTAVKAALVAEVLNAAVSSGIGNFAKATTAMLNDLSDGTLNAAANNQTPVDILTSYNTATGNSFTLTTGIDNVVGTSGNDTISTSFTKAADITLTPLDVVDGGAGDDTLTIVDAATASGAAFTFPGTATVKNVETVNFTTTGLGTINTTGWSGVKNLNVTSADAAATTSTVTASDTTAITATAASGALVTVGGSGAKLVNAGTGTNNASGNALSSVSVTGGAATTISNTTKTTLTTVSLTSVDGNTGITGNGVKDVTIGGINTAGRTVTITNAVSGGYDLTVHAAGTATAAGVSTQTTVVASTANTVAIDAQGKASLALTAVAATGVTISGSGALTLDASTSTLVTSIAGATATGSLDLGNLNAAVTTVSTGSGADKLQVNATTAATVSTGAGADVVTIGAVTLAAGSAINLGDGNDKLIGTQVIAVSGGGKTTVIDGGAGTDTISAALINNGNGAQFVNFETLGLTATTLDVSLLTGSTISALELVAGGGTYTNVTQAQALSVTGTTAGTTTLTFSGVSGTADAYAVTFNAAGNTDPTTPDTISAGTLSLNGIEALTINSGSASGYTTNQVVLADTDARTLTVTGAQNTTLTFGTFGKTGTGNGVSSIDASANSGVVTLTTNNIVVVGNTSIKTGAGADVLNINHAATAAQVSTISSGAGNDTITLGATVLSSSVVDAGAGNDTITLNAAGATVTTGTGTDTVDVHLSLGNVAAITDAAAGDKIILLDKGAETFTTAKVDVSAAQDFATALASANTAAAGNGTDGSIVWFQFGGNTYILEDNTAGAYAAATDIVVKLTGTVDLSTATLGGAGTNVLTLH